LSQKIDKKIKEHAWFLATEEFREIIGRERESLQSSSGKLVALYGKGRNLQIIFVPPLSRDRDDKFKFYLHNDNDCKYIIAKENKKRGKTTVFVMPRDEENALVHGHNFGHMHADMAEFLLERVLDYQGDYGRHGFDLVLRGGYVSVSTEGNVTVHGKSESYGAPDAKTVKMVQKNLSWMLDNFLIENEKECRYDKIEKAIANMGHKEPDSVTRHQLLEMHRLALENSIKFRLDSEKRIPISRDNSVFMRQALVQ